MKIVLYVEVYRNGVRCIFGASFWAQKKHSANRWFMLWRGIGYCARTLAPLNAFPFARRGAPCKEQRDSNGGAVTDEVA